MVKGLIHKFLQLDNGCLPSRGSIQDTLEQVYQIK